MKRGRPKKQSVAGSIDAYSFFMLKRMIEFEVEPTFAVIPDKVKVIAYIKNESPFPNEDKAMIAEYVRKNLWNPDPEKVTEEALNWMVKLVSKMGNYSSWKDFERTFAKSLYPSVRLSLADPYDATHIRQQTQLQLMVLYYRRWQQGYVRDLKKEHVLVSQLEYHDINIDHYTVRAALDDVPHVYSFYQVIGFNRHREYATLVEWYAQNRNIFYCSVADIFGVIGCLTILPIKLDFIAKLKTGNTNMASIEAKDIHSVEERETVQYVLIEALMSYHISAIKDFRKLFFHILSQIVDLEKNDNVTIGAVGCSTQAQNILTSHGFTKTGDLVHLSDTENRRYPFYEISFKGLLESLKLKTALICMLGPELRGEGNYSNIDYFLRPNKRVDITYMS